MTTKHFLQIVTQGSDIYHRQWQCKHNGAQTEGKHSASKYEMKNESRLKHTEGIVLHLLSAVLNNPSVKKNPKFISQPTTY